MSWSKEYRREYMKQYRQEHKEHIKESKRIYRQKHKEEIAEKQKKRNEKWYQNNKELAAKRKKKWYKTGKGKALSQRTGFKRRTNYKGVINTLTHQEWKDILIKFDFKCVYCGCSFNKNNPPTKDHRIPISKGGQNIKENVVPACKSCNSKKYNHIFEEEDKNDNR